MGRRLASAMVAVAAATSLLATTPGPVLAECPYLPPWPPITGAVPTARTIVVGEVVADVSHSELGLGADQGLRDYAFRVTEVLRGDAETGELLDIQYLTPNWPQVRFRWAEGALASCTYVRAAPGEVLAFAFDATHPGGRMTEQGYAWIQPPTRYHAVGVIQGPGGNQGTMHYREPVTLQQLRALAVLPMTDARAAAVTPSPSPSVAILAGLFAFGVAFLRFGRVGRSDPRSAPRNGPAPQRWRR